MTFDLNFILWIYLLLINTISFTLFRTDKKRARKREWRIPESALLFTSLLGGSLGAIIGMQFYNHKTKKIKFIIGMPIILILNILIVKYLLTT